jgi:hypothetical protein
MFSSYGDKAKKEQLRDDIIKKLFKWDIGHGNPEAKLFIVWCGQINANKHYI